MSSHSSQNTSLSARVLQKQTQSLGEPLLPRTGLGQREARVHSWRNERDEKCVVDMGLETGGHVDVKHDFDMERRSEDGLVECLRHVVRTMSAVVPAAVPGEVRS